MKALQRSFLLLIILLVSSVGFAQDAPVPVDINALTAELQKDSPVKDEMTLVWWIPQDYWRVILEQEKLSEGQIREFLGVLRPYTLVAVFDARLDASGKARFKSETQLRSTMRIVDANGTEYSALDKNKVGPGAQALLDVIRPMLNNVLGSVGTNFHFLFFPGLNSKDEPLADPKREGKMLIRLERGREFAWTLPLSSLVPQKKCPVDGQKMSGTWRYCPWHGAELKN